jgi:hypothetical protein
MNCCGPTRISAGGSCIAAARRRRADVIGRQVVSAHPPQEARRLGPGPGRVERSAGSRRSRRRLAVGVGPPLGRGRPRPWPWPATAAVAHRVGPRGAGRPDRPGARARRSRARSRRCTRPRTRVVRRRQGAPRPSDDGTIVVYAGDLLMGIGTESHAVQGNLELRLGPRPEFSAQVAGRGAWLLAPASESQHLTVTLPPGAALDPPPPPCHRLDPKAPPRGPTYRSRSTA